MFRVVIPSFRSVALVGVAGAIASVGALVAVAFAHDMVTRGDLGSAWAGFVFFAAAPLGFGLVVAALFEGRPIPRGAMVVGAGLLMVGSGLV
ncbi:MAG: hypothetical protein ABMB14_24190, partial [Myxococcota bacterium]